MFFALIITNGSLFFQFDCFHAMLATKTREAFENTRLIKNHLFKLYRKILNQGMGGKCCARNSVGKLARQHQWC